MKNKPLNLDLKGLHTKDNNLRTYKGPLGVQQDDDDICLLDQYSRTPSSSPAISQNTSKL